MLRASLMSLLALGLAAQAPVKPAPAAPAATSAQAKPAAPAQAAPKPEEKVVARVGGEPITEADVMAAFSKLPQQERMQLLMFKGGKEEFIKRMAESKLLAVKAKSMGLDKTPEFQRTLELTKEDLLAREYLNKEGAALQKQLNLTDADVKAYYDAHQDKFHQPELVSVRHILVAVKRDPKDTVGMTDAEAKQRIALIQADLRKKGADFAALAKKYSDDPGSKDNGGLYENVDPSHWDPTFAAAAMSQPIGKVGAPVRSHYGYHLIKVESRKPARTIPFDEAKTEARQLATQERQGQVWDQLMDRLKKEIPFELATPAPSDAPKPAPAAKAQAPAQTPKPAAGGAH